MTATACVALLAVAGCSEPDHPRATPGPPDIRSSPPTANTPTATGTALPATPLPLDQDTLDRRLIDAAWANDVDRARRLLAQGANPNAKDATVQSAYLVATSEGHLDLLELTLRHGADVGSRDRFDGTGLIRAAERGHGPVVGRLIQEGIAIDHVNNLGWTALHEAIILGDGSQRYLDTVRILVAAGADLTLPSRRDGIRPVEHARSKGYVALADLLAGAIAANTDEARAGADERLLRAAATGDADGAAVALRAGAELETRDADRRTPLLLAVTEDNVAVARLLVALGADPDALDARHDTPWLVTGVTGSVPMAEVLLPAHPDLTIRNRFGGVSLIPASERGHVDYVRRVVRTGIDVNHVNDLGWTAMLEAVILGDGSARYQEIVRILLEAGADPALADTDGVTALQHARARGQDAVAAILQRGS